MPDSRGVPRALLCPPPVALRRFRDSWGTRPGGAHRRHCAMAGLTAPAARSCTRRDTSNTRRGRARSSAFPNRSAPSRCRSRSCHIRSEYCSPPPALTFSTSPAPALFYSLCPVVLRAPARPRHLGEERRDEFVLAPLWRFTPLRTENGLIHEGVLGCLRHRFPVARPGKRSRPTCR